MDKKIKGVIFDMDGVLFDSESRGLECFLLSCKEVGIEPKAEPYIATIGTTYARSDEILMDFFKDEALFKKAMDYFNKIFRGSYPKGEIKLKKGARELIQYLTDNDIPFALATSSPLFIAEMSFINQGYKQIPFKYIMTGDNVVNSKPHPEIFNKAAQLMGLDPKDCMVIEDSRNGIFAAQATGGVAVLVPDIVPVDEDMINAATYKLNDLVEVRELVEKLIDRD